MWARYSPQLLSLPLTKVTEEGVLFETHVPVTFRWLRNTEGAPNFGERFQQHIEPAGRYVIHNENPGDLPRGWETGVVTLRNHLVMSLNTRHPDEIYGPHSWKANLHRVFGAKGRRLSDRLRGLGIDGIVTTDRDGTREIVLL